MELRHLRYLVAVAQEQSFLRAARRLRVAQSALSTQIRDLETEVGVKLFDRLPRGVRLTRAGAVFLREARSTLENAERAVISARRANQQADALLHFGHGYLTIYAPIILRLLAEFRQAYPDSDVEIHNLDEVEQRTALFEHRLDVAATFLGVPISEAFGCLPLMDCSAIGALIPAAHPLAERERIRVRDLKDLTFLHVPASTWPELNGVINKALARRGLVVTRHRARSPDAHTANLEIAAGGAWALATDAMAAHYSGMANAIAYRPFVEPPIPFQMALIWRRHGESRLLRGLLDIARKLSERSLVA